MEFYTKTNRYRDYVEQIDNFEGNIFQFLRDITNYPLIVQTPTNVMYRYI